MCWTPARPLGTVICRFFDRVSGEGIPGLPVELVATELDDGIVDALRGLGIEPPGRRYRSETKGAYRFEDVLPGYHRFRFDVHRVRHVPPGYFRTPEAPRVRIGSGEIQSDLAVGLEPGGAISGTVVDADGNGVSRARLRLVSSKSSYVYDFDDDSLRASNETWDVESGEGGAFRFVGLGAQATYSVVAAHAGHAPSYTGAILLPEPIEIEGVQVALDSGHRVRGRLVDDDGTGIPDIRVRLGRGFGQRYTSFGFPWVGTDEDGSFTFDSVASGSYTVFVHAPEFHTSRLPSFDMPADRDELDLTFDLERRKPGFVRGRVTDAGGQPLRNVTIAAFGRDGVHSFLTTRTSEDGTYAIGELGRSTQFEISASRSGFATEQRFGIVLNSVDVDFVLERNVTVSGRVVDASTGEPIPRFEVRAVSFRRNQGGQRAPWRSVEAEDGSFEMNELEPPAGRIEVRAPAYAPTQTDRLEVRPGERLEGLEIRLGAGSRIRGGIVDASTDTSLAGAFVHLYEGPFHARLLTSGVPIEREESRVTQSDQIGEFLFDDLPGGKKHDLVVWRPGYATLVLTAVSSYSGEPERMTLALRRESRLHVRLTRDGKPERVSVYLDQLDAPPRAAYRAGMLCESGTAELAGVPSGTYRLLVEDSSRQLVGYLRVSLPAEERVDLPLELPRSGTGPSPAP